MSKILLVLLSLCIVTVATAQDITIVPNYINGIRIGGALLDDLDDVGGGGGPAGAAGGDLDGNYPNPSIRTGAVDSDALADSEITTDACGDSTNVPQMLFSEDGIGISCTEIPIAFPTIADNSITSAKLTSVVSAATCGDSTNVCRITFNAKGQITLATQEAISGEPTGGIGPEELESTTIVAGACGDATHFAIPIFDEDGRATGCTEQEIVATELPDALEGNSLKLTPVVETTTCNMAYSNHKISPTGTTTCTLPAAASTTVGTYNFYHMNSNNLVIARTGSDIINGTAGNLAAIQGPLTHIQCSVIDTTLNWQCSVTTFAGYGAPFSTICMDFGGGTNSSNSGSGSYIDHSLTCQIDPGKLTTGSELEICSAWQWTGAATPPSLNFQWKAGDTVLNTFPGNGLPPAASATRNTEYCMSMGVSAAPGAAVPTYNVISNSFTPSLSVTLTGVGGTVQPVNLATDGALIFKQASRWLDAGTGTSTVTQLWMRVRGSGLLP